MELEKLKDVNSLKLKLHETIYGKKKEIKTINKSESDANNEENKYECLKEIIDKLSKDTTLIKCSGLKSIKIENKTYNILKFKSRNSDAELISKSALIGNYFIDKNLNTFNKRTGENEDITIKCSIYNNKTNEYKIQDVITRLNVYCDFILRKDKIYTDIINELIERLEIKNIEETKDYWLNKIELECNNENIKFYLKLTIEYIYKFHIFQSDNSKLTDKTLSFKHDRYETINGRFISRKFKIQNLKLSMT